MFKPIMFYEKVNNCTLNMLLKMQIFLYTLKNMSKYDFIT